jgi:hypothetical protein
MNQMTTPDKVHGLWWFPEAPDDRWVGDLKLERNRTPRLSVTIPRPYVEVANQKDRVVHGTDANGRPITLLFVGPPRSVPTSVFTRASFSAGSAVLGIELANVESFQVHTLLIRIQHLYEWSGISGFTSNPPGTVDGLQIHYVPPIDLTFPINSDLTVELRPSYRQTHESRERKIGEDVIIAFKSNKGLGWVECKKFVNAIRHLLHFAILEPVFACSISGIKNGYGGLCGDQFIHRDIDIWTGDLRDRVESELVAERWVFKFKDVQPDFRKFLALWLDYVQKFSESLNDYCAAIYHRLPHEMEHLSLTQALDAYHGLKYASHEQHGYEKKLLELITTQKPSLSGLIDDPAGFARTVLHNRNYYTHHNPKWKDEGRVVSGADLYRLNEKLRLLFQMSVLSDIGIPRDRFPRLRRQLASTVIDYL